jgi:hypothetical protein
MVVVGMNLKTDTHFLLVRIMQMVNANVLQVSKVTVSKVAMTLMNAKKRELVSALIVAAKIHGEATIALVAGIFCISGTTIPA